MLFHFLLYPVWLLLWIFQQIVIGVVTASPQWQRSLFLTISRSFCTPFILLSVSLGSLLWNVKNDNFYTDILVDATILKGITIFDVVVVTHHWSIQGGRQGRPSLRIQFLSFSCSSWEIFDQIVGRHPHLGGWRPRLGNSGSVNAH